jgi:uncharacterized membrane protein
MTDFQIWLYGSIFLTVSGCIFTYLKNTFSVEVFNFIAFVAAIGYIILNRYTEGQWAAIPLIWLAGMIISAILLLMSQSRQQRLTAHKK